MFSGRGPCTRTINSESLENIDKFRQVYLFYNQKIIDPCGTYIQSQVNTGINIGIIYNMNQSNI